MHDIIPSPTRVRALVEYRVGRLFLSPPHWQKITLPTGLQWTLVPFDPSNAEKIPDDSAGVYSFIVVPGIAQHPACHFLLYVGKVESQYFRARFQQYLREASAGDEARRPHITEMLEKWSGYLWFCYAPIAEQDKISQTEDSLLAAYLPPFNRDFPASVRTELKRALTT